MENLVKQDEQNDQKTSKDEETKNRIQTEEPISHVSTLLQESHVSSCPQNIEAEVDHETNSITLTVREFDVVIVGQSTGVHKQSCHVHKYLKDHDDDQKDESTFMSTNYIKGCEVTFRSQKEIVHNETHPDLTINNVSVDSTTSTTIKTDYTLPMIKKQGFLNGKQCERIIERLVHLQDNGKFHEHKVLVAAFLKRCREEQNVDMEFNLLLEQGVASSYHREFRKSKKLFTSIINRRFEYPLRNESLLKARAYYLIVDNAVDRFRKVRKIQPMQECLQRSQLLLQNHDSPQDWAELYYTRGNLGLACMSTMPMSGQRQYQARRLAQDEVKHNFELAIAFCKKDHRSRIQIKLQIYCHLKVAQLLLDSFSKAAMRFQNVLPPEQIKEAQKHLDFVEFQLGADMPVGTQVELLQTRCDQFYHQEKFQLAKETAEYAYNIADCNSGFYFLDALQERIKFLEHLCENKIRLVVDDDLSSSGSEASCESSSNESG